MHDVDGLNAGYAQRAARAVPREPRGGPDEWRALFESGASELVATHPGLARLRRAPAQDGNGHAAAPPRRSRLRRHPPAPPRSAGSRRAARRCRAAAPPPPDKTLLAAVAAAMALVKAYRTHGHLAARLDPLGSEPVGDPSLEPGAPRARS